MNRSLVRVALALLAASGACAAWRRADSATPVIARLEPDSVQVSPGAVVEVVVTGSGFVAGDPGENTVHFGAAVMRRVRANDDGTRLVFTIPDVIPSGGEAPPSPVVPGPYPVRIETTHGSSNVLVLQVVR